MKALVTRTLSGVLFAAGMVAGMVIHPLLFAVVFLLLTIFVLLEFYDFCALAGATPSRSWGAFLGALFFLLFFAVAARYLPVRAAGVLPLLPFPLLIIELYRRQEHPLANMAFSLASFLYVVVPMSMASLLIFTRDGESSRFYPWILFGVTLTIWLYDSGAYLLGTAFGKHRLFERISPRKSWEGVLGGGVTAMLTGILNARLFPALELHHWLVISAIVILFGTWGDLVESLLKRSLQIKDSGSVLPGHGGFLDRFDSFLLVLPIVAMWLWITGIL